MPLIAKGVKHKLVAQIGRYSKPEKSQVHLEMLIPARGRCFYQNQDEEKEKLMPLAGFLVAP